MDDGSLVLTRHKLDADNYYRMAETGILAREDRVELIDGEIIDMAPIGQDHVSTVNRLNEALVLICTGRAIISPQNTLRLDRLNVPEPDFAILKYRADYYSTGEPASPADVLLLIEVSDSSLEYDRTVKLPLYAISGIPEVWIIDVKRRVVESHRHPEGDKFALSSIHKLGETVHTQYDQDIKVVVSEVFSPYLKL